MKKLLAMFLTFIMILSMCTIVAYATETHISDELLAAVKDDYIGLDGIEKSDINLYYNLHIKDDKYLVRLTLRGCMYSADIVCETIGNYRLVSSRPLPQIFANGQLYEIGYAYENAIIDDDDLKIISTFEQLSFVNKLNPQLQDHLLYGTADTKVDIDITIGGYKPNAIQMPSWPDKGAARAELNAYYNNWYQTEIVPVVFEGVEYEEIFVGSGLVIVSVKASDVAKIASHDIVESVSYFENANDEVQVEQNYYKDRFILQYELGDVNEEFPLIYCELGQVDVDADDGMDYAIIYARTLIGADQMTYLDLGTSYLYNPQIYDPLYYGYALYDIENDEFIPIENALNGDYPFIYECIEEFKIGIPYGDADKDGEITVLDATEIQRFCAGLTNKELKRDCDINRDNEVNILDATDIQKKLAQL